MSHCTHGTHTLTHDAHEWVTSHIWMSHVTHMNESWHTYEWVMSHIWMRHRTHMNESWHTWHSHVETRSTWCACVLQCFALCCSVLHCVAVYCSVLQNVAVCCTHPKPYTLRHVAHEWVMAHIWMSHGTHVTPACHGRQCYRHSTMSGIHSHCNLGQAVLQAQPVCTHMGWLRSVGSMKL